MDSLVLQEIYIAENIIDEFEILLCKFSVTYIIVYITNILYR